MVDRFDSDNAQAAAWMREIERQISALLSRGSSRRNLRVAMPHGAWEFVEIATESRTHRYLWAPGLPGMGTVFGIRAYAVAGSRIIVYDSTERAFP